MVKHGRNKKRRAGRIGRTKLKNRNFRTWDPKPNIRDATVQKLWDVKKTTRQNLLGMGLAVEPNGDSRGLSPPAAATANVTTNAIELFDVPESDLPSRSTLFPMNREDQDYIVRCMNKYGTDYTDMFRDIRVNYLQHTREKLQKMGARFFLLNPNQVLLDDIPTALLEKMQHGDAIGKQLQEKKEKKENEMNSN